MRNLMNQYGLTILELVAGSLALNLIYNSLINNSQIISLIEKMIYSL